MVGVLIPVKPSPDCGPSESTARVDRSPRNGGPGGPQASLSNNTPLAQEQTVGEQYLLATFRGDRRQRPTGKRSANVARSHERCTQPPSDASFMTVRRQVSSLLTIATMRSPFVLVTRAPLVLIVDNSRVKKSFQDLEHFVVATANASVIREIVLQRLVAEQM